jgi:hypothetical protein
MARLELDSADLKRILGKFDRIGRTVDDRILRQELNRAGRQLRTDLTRRVKADLGRLPVGTIRRRIEVIGVYNQGDGDVVLEERIRKRPINLARFGARQTKRGIKAIRVAGSTRGPFRHGFIIAAKFGDGGSTKIAVERVGRARLPVKGLFGPTIMGTAVPHAPKSLATAGEKLLANVQRRISSEMRR